MWTTPALTSGWSKARSAAVALASERGASVRTYVLAEPVLRAARAVVSERGWNWSRAAAVAYGATVMSCALDTFFEDAIGLPPAPRIVTNEV